MGWGKVVFPEKPVGYAGGLYFLPLALKGVTGSVL